MTRFIIIFSLAIASFTSCADKAEVKETEGVTATAVNTEVVSSYSELDIKPRFGGCEDNGDEAALKSCSDKLMAEFISKNLKYPETARAKGIEGKAIVSFVIEPNGSLSDIKAETNLGGGLEEEAVRVFELMNTEKQWWVPGRKNGKRQRVKLQLPISFKM